MAEGSKPQQNSLILMLVVILLIGLGITAVTGVREKQTIIEKRDESLTGILNDMEIQFSSFYQTIATTTELVGHLPLIRESHENFLKGIFSSSQSELLYGVGIWYAPGCFEPETALYGPYVRRDEPAAETWSLTYEWNSREYDYPGREWYKTLAALKKGEITVIPPYDGGDYTYITFGGPFFRNGSFQGVVTADIIVPRLAHFLDQFDFESFDSIYLSDRQGQPIYVHGHEGKIPSSSSIHAYLQVSKNNPFLFTAESENSPFILFGTMGPGDFIKELRQTRISFFITLIFGMSFLIWHAFMASNSRHRSKNRQLSQENVALKDEIEIRKRTEAQLQYLAFHDSVTGLENLRALKEKVSPPEGARDRRQLMQVSLDNIRELSYVLDEDFIDSLLHAFAVKLKDSCPPGARIFRGNGFIFFLLFENMDEKEAEITAHSYLERFRRTISHKGKEVRPRLRISIIPFREAVSMDQLISQAGMTLTEGIGDPSYRYSRVIRYDDELNRKRTERMELETAMGSSDFLEELLVYYQPIVRLRDRRVMGYEALVRWMSAKKGMLIPPDRFIPLAEENGHIIEIGWFVIREALRILSTLGREKSWFISVNVSPVQFLDSDFLARLDGLVEEYGIGKKRLKLEITETYAGKGAVFFWDSLRKLVEAGYLLVMDDFGTGESSLGRLQSEAFDTLKLDRLFVSHLQENSRQIGIMESLISLNNVLGTTLIAEGVEEEEEHELLLSMNVPYAQGYLYSRPIPEEEMTVREKSSDGEN